MGKNYKIYYFPGTNYLISVIVIHYYLLHSDFHIFAARIIFADKALPHWHFYLKPTFYRVSTR